MDVKLMMMMMMMTSAIGEIELSLIHHKIQILKYYVTLLG